MNLTGTYRQARRLVITIIGGTVVLIGVALLVLPGPGTVVIVLGLAILATEWVWARRLLKRLKTEGKAVSHTLGEMFGWRRGRRSEKDRSPGQDDHPGGEQGGG